MSTLKLDYLEAGFGTDITINVGSTILGTAKIFKIKDKGFIKEGFDADLTIIDLNLEKEVKNNELFAKCGWSPFDGWNLKGWPVTTVVNGSIVFDAEKSKISGTNSIGNGKINNIAAKEVLYNE